VSSLGLLSFERKEFIKRLNKIKNAFVIEIRNVKQLAVLKA